MLWGHKPYFTESCPQERVYDVAVAMLAVLARMHALGIIHRDVKLENIFIGGGEELKLGDFGLTMSMKQELAISPVGTVEYMAPEVCVACCMGIRDKGCHTSRVVHEVGKDLLISWLSIVLHAACHFNSTGFVVLIAWKALDC